MLRRTLLALGVVAAVLVATTAGAVTQWVICDPVNVVAFGPRIHVKCAASIGGVQYFARSTSDAADAARFLNVLLAAHVSGRPLDIFTDLADTSRTPVAALAAVLTLAVITRLSRRRASGSRWARRDQNR